MAIIKKIIVKSCEEESTPRKPVREPRKVGGGTEETAEHGLGAGRVNGEPAPGASRYRRLRCCFRHESRWYRVNSVALGFPRGLFIFRRKRKNV